MYSYLLMVVGFFALSVCVSALAGMFVRYGEGMTSCKDDEFFPNE